jgi:hypothetical protein
VASGQLLQSVFSGDFVGVVDDQHVDRYISDKLELWRLSGLKVLKAFPGFPVPGFPKGPLCDGW